MSPRVSILTDVPAPHRTSVFRRLASYVDLQVVFDACPESEGAGAETADLGFGHVFSATGPTIAARDSNQTGSRFERTIQPGHNVLRYLWRFRPQVVISCDMGLRSLQAEVYCRVSKIPLIIWNESTLHGEGWVSSRKRRVRRHFARVADRFWTSGQEAASLLGSYGAPPDRIDHGMMAADGRLVLSGLDDPFRRERDTTRATLGLHGTVFCFTGEFVSRKGIHEYLEAIRRLKSSVSRPFSLIFIGEGPEHAAMEKWLRATGCSLIIAGFGDYSARRRFYAAADVFVLPTLEDNWSLATLEAAVAGLPQIFSKFNGAASDLAALGAPGTIVNPYDVGTLTSILESYTIAPPARASQLTSNMIARLYSPQECARRMCASIERGLTLPPDSIQSPSVDTSKPPGEAEPAQFLRARSSH